MTHEMNFNHDKNIYIYIFIISSVKLEFTEFYYIFLWNSNFTLHQTVYHRDTIVHITGTFCITFKLVN